MFFRNHLPLRPLLESRAATLHKHKQFLGTANQIQPKFLDTLQAYLFVFKKQFIIRLLILLLWT